MRHRLAYLGLLLGGLGACSSPDTQRLTAAPARAAVVVPTTRPAPAPPAYPYTLPPTDQTAHYPALQAFVQQVLAACAARQQVALLALVADSVIVSYGGGISGKTGFVSDFLNAGPRGSGYSVLEEAIRLGGTVQRDPAGRLLVTYPYAQDSHLYERNRWLAGLELDPFQSYVGLSANVLIYGRPDTTSPLLARLPYPVLRTREDAPTLPGDWLQVLAADSSFQGYTRASQLYYLASPTLTIEQRGTRFWITSVAPYD